MSKKDESIIGWLIIVILILPFIAFTSTGTKQKSKKQIANLVGLVVLGIIIIGASIHYFLLKKEEEKTISVMNEVARGFADHNNEIMMKWARGEYVDTWGNSIILSENDFQNGVCFVSKGRDCCLGTEDDVSSNHVSMSQKPVPTLNIVVEPPPKKGVATRIKESIGRIGDFFK